MNSRNAPSSPCNGGPGVPRRETSTSPSSAMVLIGNHLRQFLSCDVDVSTEKLTWQWHATPQPWNPHFQFQFLTWKPQASPPTSTSTSTSSWEPFQGPFEVQQKVVWIIRVQSKLLYIGWNPRQEPCVYSEPCTNATWTVKASHQQMFTLVNSSNLLLTTLPNIHLSSNPPMPLTQFHYQWIPSTQPPTSPGFLESHIAFYQAPYVLMKAPYPDAPFKLKKMKHPTLDIECVLLQLYHVKWIDEHWEIEEKVDLYRSNGRHVALKLYPSQKYLCSNSQPYEKNILIESDTLEEQGVFEFHKLPHSPLAFALRSICQHKYLGICKGKLSWVQPTSKQFFWTFLVPPTFAQAIVDAPKPKMPKRMMVTMTAIITTAAVGAVTGISNFFLSF
ncbi:hypothetical protein HMI54_007906 [Coelomomyces lativittatus]|nr:hypothetical protein HMI54_007906 [Coelomomyces lativittatus]KAJ1506266.1 hypothetical protein HMI56_000688 [Coelomomyces lativittatus]KAJ1506387.1 hypothetical protein HMI55_001200 [Coelomomyces lativittatus]